MGWRGAGGGGAAEMYLDTIIKYTVFLVLDPG
jgi:hypothetical protein